MAEMIAPAGMVWICGACGKTARGNYGSGGSKWWDESCSMNSLLIEEGLPQEAARPWRVWLKTKHPVPQYITQGAFSTPERAAEALALFLAADPAYEHFVSDAVIYPPAEPAASPAQGKADKGPGR